MFVAHLVVSTSATDCPARLVSELTSYVSSRRTKVNSLGHFWNFDSLGAGLLLVAAKAEGAKKKATKTKRGKVASKTLFILSVIG